MSLTPITTHQQDAAARLLEQSRFRPNLGGVLTALTQAVQQLENQVQQVATGCALFGGAAVGAQLDGIGQLVGASRGGLTDAQFLVLIAGTIGANTSHADSESLLNIAGLIFEAQGCQLNSGFSAGHSHSRAPATVGLELGSPALPASYFPAAISILKRSMAAGVALSWVSTYDSTGSFALAGPQAGQGLGDATVPGSGGTLAMSVYSDLTA